MSSILRRPAPLSESPILLERQLSAMDAFHLARRGAGTAALGAVADWEGRLDIARPLEVLRRHEALLAQKHGSLLRASGASSCPSVTPTIGSESFCAGRRYLDIERPEEGRVHVAFNLSSNPCCAYDDAYSCPLPPPDNSLHMPLRAGEAACPR